jgi:hypothetical protein
MFIQNSNYHILHFVHCASLYNLVNKTNLVHSLFLVYTSDQKETELFK